MPDRLPRVAGDDDWPAHKLLVTSQLERIEDRLDGLVEKIVNVQVEIGALKIKSGVWGAAAGVLVAVAAAIWAAVRH